MRPLYVYDNWSSYDELSDNIRLTEELAMFQFNELLRLRSLGVQFDAYLMDAFWYEPSGAYLEWRKPDWPQGPKNWLAKCQENGIKPGLWFPANTLFTLDLPEAWRNSADEDKWGLCCFHGGFLQGFMEVLRHWYRQGVRVFKFDFASFTAAPNQIKQEKPPEEIKALNIQAYREALRQLRKDCPEVVLLAYNGFEKVDYMWQTDGTPEYIIDPAWLEVFDTIYSGDPRPADVPLPNFWRTLDVYTDRNVKLLMDWGLIPEQIDNCSFMMGKAGTCYGRGNQDWKTSYLLSLARGGKVHMTLGNLEAFTSEDAEFMAKAQRIFEKSPLGIVTSDPGKATHYYLLGDNFAFHVNAGLSNIFIPIVGKVIYPAGFGGEMLPGSVALDWRGPQVESLGEDPQTYAALRPIRTNWHKNDSHVEATINPTGGPIHLIFQQFNKDGHAVRTTEGAPPKGRPMSALLQITATQNGDPLPVERPDDKVLWCGLSWAYGIIHPQGSDPITVQFQTTDKQVTRIEARTFQA